MLLRAAAEHFVFTAVMGIRRVKSLAASPSSAGPGYQLISSKVVSVRRGCRRRLIPTLMLSREWSVLKVSSALQRNRCQRKQKKALSLSFLFFSMSDKELTCLPEITSAAGDAGLQNNHRIKAIHFKVSIALISRRHYKTLGFVVMVKASGLIRLSKYDLNLKQIILIF